MASKKKNKIENKTRKNSTRVSVKNRTYKTLANNEKTFVVRTTKSSQVGVKFLKTGLKKAISVELVLPSTTLDGSERTVRLNLSGRQFSSLVNAYDYFLSKEFKAENPTL